MPSGGRSEQRSRPCQRIDTYPGDACRQSSDKRPEGGSGSLRSLFGRHDAGGECHDVAQTIQIDHVPCPFGGSRMYSAQDVHGAVGVSQSPIRAVALSCDAVAISSSMVPRTSMRWPVRSAPPAKSGSTLLVRSTACSIPVPAQGHVGEDL
jgi:hypothetical protein